MDSLFRPAAPAGVGYAQSSIYISTWSTAMRTLTGRKTWMRGWGDKQERERDCGMEMMLGIKAYHDAHEC